MKIYNLLVSLIISLKLFSCGNGQIQNINRLITQKRSIEDSIKLTESKYLEVKNVYDSLTNLADSTNKEILTEMDLKEQLMFNYSLKTLKWSDSLNRIKLSIDSLERLK